MRPFTFWASALALLLPVGAFADSSSVVVRVGSHDGYGRIAFALPPRTDYQLTQQDQHVVIQFSGDLKIGPANAIPRNVVAIKGGERQATLDLAPGTVMHDWRYGDLLVIDVRDPGTQLPAASGQATIAKNPDAAKPAQAKGQSTQPDSARLQPAQPDTGKPAASKPETATPTTPKLAPAAGTSDGVPASAPPASAIAPDHEQLATAPNLGAPGPPQAAIQPVPPQSDAAPAAPSQASVSTEKAQPEAASAKTSDGVLDIQADPQLGLAVFRLRKVAMIVLDQQRTIDMAPLHDDAVFGSAVVQMLPTATVIRVPVEFWRNIGILARGGNVAHCRRDSRNSRCDRSRRWWQTTVCCCRQQPQVRLSASLIRILGPLCSSALNGVAGKASRCGAARRNSPCYRAGRASR